MKNVEKECEVKIPSVLYFYSNLKDCEDCEKQGYVLTYLKKKNSDLNIFSFDINMDDIALGTLKELYDIETAELPIVVINDKIFEGFTELEDLNKVLSENAM